MKKILSILFTVLFLFTTNLYADTVFNEYVDLDAVPASTDEFIMWDTSEGDVKNVDYSYISPGIDDSAATSTAITIDASGLVIVGTSAAVTTGGTQSTVQTHGTALADSSATVARWSGDATGPLLILGKSRGAIGTVTIVQDGDDLGAVAFYGADGGDFSTPGARIRAAVDGTPGANDLPTELLFQTTPDAGNAPVTNMVIDEGGIVTMGVYGAGTATFSAAGVISSVSSQSVKDKDGDLDNAIETIMQFPKPSFYRFNSNAKKLNDGTRHFGFMAEDINAILPEAAPKSVKLKYEIDADGREDKTKIKSSKTLYGIYDRSIIALAVQAIQEQQVIIEDLTDRIEALER